jgi:hypothetical protein
MDQENVKQLAREMTDLCKNGARSATLFATSPAGKALFVVVLSVLLEVDPDGDFRLWWKPQT